MKTMLLALFLDLSVPAAPAAVLEWDRSASPEVVFYRIHYGPLPGLYTEAMDVGDRDFAEMPEIPPGETRYLVVTGVNAAGLESEPSNEVSYTEPATVRPHDQFHRRRWVGPTTGND